MKVAWVSSWDRICGIADYSKDLWPEVKKQLEGAGHEGFLISLDETGNRKKLIQKLESLKPDLIHFQHEYGLYGGKNPPLYIFPSLIKILRKKLPHTKIIATAHTVLSENFRYPTHGRGWQKPLRILANAGLINFLNSQWNKLTWGSLNGVVVHSKFQVKNIQSTGTPIVKVIPHFVNQRERVIPQSPVDVKKVLVFGFFSSDKGQDIAIDAFKNFRNEKIHLILAGGVRRAADQKYFELCKEKITQAHLQSQVTFTGFIKSEDLQKYFIQSSLIIAPFRVTSGSGSLAQSLSRGLPILASDLLLNQEINERVKGTLEFFKSEDPTDLYKKIRELLNDDRKLNQLRENAVKYSQSNSPTKTATLHLDFYKSVMNS